MKKVILLLGLIASIFLLDSCYTAKRAWHYNYHFNKNDKLYITSFQNQDSLSLKNIKNIQFVLLPDSLIVFEDSIITKKFYKDYFEVYKKLSPKDLCIYEYSYNGNIISVSCYYMTQLRLKKINEKGKMQTKYLWIGTPRF